MLFYYDKIGYEMSSTNRSSARDKHIADYYVTPIPSIVDFLMEFFNDRPDLSFDGSKAILDPCAGGDNSHPMSYPEAIGKWKYENPPFINTMDIREDSKAEIKDDYLSYTNLYYDVIITNPPFNIALDVIKKALTEVKDGGLVIMLLRLNFFGSKARSEWFQDNMPNYVYVHSRRMKFLNTGGTDSIEYCHCVWIKGQSEKFSKMRVI
jgi:hypothetical protein